MTSALTTMEGEIVLLAMLPEGDRMLLVQTPRLRTIADLEGFIVDEYIRVFPHLPALSRDLRIQKCVSPEMVVDRRSHAKVRQQSPHCFVDLAKNVQAGNVFTNMEQIYIVINEGVKKQKHHDPKRYAEKENPAVNKVVSEKKQDAVEEASHEKKAEKKVTTENHDAKKTTPKVPKEKTEAKNEATKEGKGVKVATKTTKESTDANKPVAKENKVSTKTTKGSTEVKKTITKESAKSKKTASKETPVAKMSTKNETTNAEKPTAEKPTAGKEETKSAKATKKVALKKSENALLKKMLAAKHDAAESGAALIVNSLHNAAAAVETKAHSSKSERTRKASEKDSTADEINVSDVAEPPAKKKKSAAKSETKKAEEAKAAAGKQTDSKEKKTTKKVVTKAAAKAESAKQEPEIKTAKTVKKKVAATKPPSKAEDDSSTASESTSTTRKSKKKLELDSNDVEKPASKRAKKEKSPKEASAKLSKKTTTVSAPTKATTAKTESGSSSSSSTSIQGDELTSVESNETQDKASKPKVGFQKILEATKNRLATEKAEAERIKNMNGPAKPEKAKQTPKSSENTATESSSDSDEVPAVVKSAKHFSKIAAPVESSSSSSSDEEELDYSQSLLADLTKNDTDEDEMTSVVNKDKASMNTDTDPAVDSSQETEESDIPSTELTQMSQESNSVLAPSLSRNRFSLGSMPVAKLKKSSKNPFSSSPKAKAKTTRPRGRPPKAKKA